jgi:hypothetical protein
MRTLVLEGFSADRLGQEINAAPRAVVYLLVSQFNLSMLSYVPGEWTPIVAPQQKQIAGRPFRGGQSTGRGDLADNAGSLPEGVKRASSLAITHERPAGPANDRDAIGKQTLISGCSSLYRGLRLARF